MKIQFNRNHELEIVGLGVFQPNSIITIDNNIEAKRYLDTGYFNIVEEKKKVEIEFKKSKKKGDDFNVCNGK